MSESPVRGGIFVEPEPKNSKLRQERYIPPPFPDDVAPLGLENYLILDSTKISLLAELGWQRIEFK